MISSGADINRRRLDGFEPVHLACWFGELETLQLLHKLGVNLEVHKADAPHPMEDGSDSASKATPLHVLCQSSRGRHGHGIVAERRALCAQYLIDQGVNHKPLDSHDRTPEDFARVMQVIGSSGEWPSESATRYTLLSAAQHTSHSPTKPHAHHPTRTGHPSSSPHAVRARGCRARGRPGAARRDRAAGAARRTPR